ncbi:hypothetical protein ACVBEF_09950 [Glaciimonas sp. GG7]
MPVNNSSVSNYNPPVDYSSAITPYFPSQTNHKIRDALISASEDLRVVAPHNNQNIVLTKVTNGKSPRELDGRIVGDYSPHKVPGSKVVTRRERIQIAIQIKEKEDQIIADQKQVELDAVLNASLRLVREKHGLLMHHENTTPTAKQDVHKNLPAIRQSTALQPRNSLGTDTVNTKAKDNSADIKARPHAIAKFRSANVPDETDHQEDLTNRVINEAQESNRKNHQQPIVQKKSELSENSRDAITPYKPNTSRHLPTLRSQPEQVHAIERFQPPNIADDIEHGKDLKFINGAKKEALRLSTVGILMQPTNLPQLRASRQSGTDKETMSGLRWPVTFENSIYGISSVPNGHNWKNVLEQVNDEYEKIGAPQGEEEKLLNIAINYVDWEKIPPSERSSINRIIETIDPVLWDAEVQVHVMNKYMDKMTLLRNRYQNMQYASDTNETLDIEKAIRALSKEKAEGLYRDMRKNYFTRLWRLISTDYINKKELKELQHNRIIFLRILHQQNVS